MSTHATRKKRRDIAGGIINIEHDRTADSEEVEFQRAWIPPRTNYGTSGASGKTRPAVRKRR